MGFIMSSPFSLNIRSLKGFIETLAFEELFLLEVDDETGAKSREWLLIPPPCGDTNCSFPSGKGANGRP